MNVNGKIVEVPNYSSIELMSEDHVYISGLKTNLPLNLGIKLRSKDIDTESLLSSPQRFGDFLNGKSFPEGEVTVSVMFSGIKLGQISFKIKPLMEEYLERATLIIDPEKKLLFLLRGIQETGYPKPLLKEYMNNLEGLEPKRKAYYLTAIDPNRVDDKGILWGLLREAKELGKGEVLEGVVKRILQMDPKDSQALWYAARFWEEMGDLEKADGHYRDGLKRWGRLKELLLGLVRVLVDKGETVLAKAYLEKLEKGERDQEYYQLLSRVSKELNDIKAYVEAMDGYFNLKPGDLEGKLEFLNFLLQNNLEKEANFYTDDIISKALGEPEILIRLTQLLETYRKDDLLLKAYNALADEGIGKDIVLFNMGTIEYDRGNYTKAKVYLEDYIRRAGEDTSALMILLDIYRRENNHLKVVETGNSLIKLGLKEPWLYELLFNTYMRTKKYDLSANLCKEAIKLFPDEPKFYHCAVESYIQTGRPKDAEEVIEGYLKRDPKDPGILLKLAEIRHRMGDKFGTIKALERYLQLRPDDQEVQEQYLRLRLLYLEEKRLAL
ncbi:MAG: tetratricopeptide repeat protein [Desulfatiglandales bacterium]